MGTRTASIGSISLIPDRLLKNSPHLVADLRWSLNRSYNSDCNYSALHSLPPRAAQAAGRARVNGPGGRRTDGRTYGSSSAFRVHRGIPLPVSPAHDGPGAAAGHPEDSSAEDGAGLLQPRRPVLGPYLRDQFRDGSGHRDPDGVSVRDQLGAFFARQRRRHRPDARDGGGVFVFP